MTAGARPVGSALGASEVPLPLVVPGRQGVRLDEFQMLNWGTFDRTVQRLVLAGGNGLLTGQVGAGKSTLVDGLTTLFAATHRVTFNRAAGADRSERTVATYVLGHHRNVFDEATGGTRPEALRDPKTAYSVLLARFLGAPGSPDGTVTAGAVFWFSDGQPNPNRLYFVAPSRLDIADHLANHADIRAVRTALRQAGCDLYENNFRAYQRTLCRSLGMTAAALDLLVQTISMKQVGNLTDFVRAHMLDGAASGDRIQKILDHYGDLTRAHELVIVAREQLDKLQPVATHAAAYTRAEARIASSTAAREAVPALVERRRLAVLDQEISRVEGQLPGLHHQGRRLKERIAITETRARQLAVAIQNEGGADLVEARFLLEQAQARLQQVTRASHELTELASVAGIAAPERSEDFTRFSSDVSDAAEAVTAADAELRDREFAARKALSDTRDELRAVREELADARTRDSNVPLELARLRGRVAEDLRIDVAALPFAAELLKVDDGASIWEPAAERLTRPLALSLLVPEQYYRDVAAWVDAHHLGRKLVYYRVPASVSRPDTPKHGTMAAHLVVRTGTAVSDWLRNQVVRRFSHTCVDDAKDLGAHARAVTRAGQAKDNDRHEKDDSFAATDRRHYVLGWDTAARRATLSAALPALEQQVTKAEEAAALLDVERADRADRAYALRQLQERFTEPSVIDVAAAHDDVVAAQEMHDNLVNAGSLRDLLKQQRDCDDELGLLHDQLSDLNQAVGAARKELNQFVDARDSTYEKLAALSDEELPAEAATALEEAQRLAVPLPTTNEGCDQWGSRLLRELLARADAAGSTRERAGRELVAAMKDFASLWPTFVTDIPTSDPASRVEFLALRDRLETDDLPRYEANFREQLQQNAIHELVAFSHFLTREAEKITGRISTINSALADISYQPGTYIRLEVEQTKDQIVRDFRAQLREVTSNALLGDDNAYAELRFLKVKELLDRFRGRDGTTAADLAWTAKVTDVRNWFSFAASERTRDEDTPVEHYTDSGGKSGGQKEKLAYTILAASLSYQYGLAGGNIAAFRFVMIDEAFGRGSDESTRFGLELFTRLGLQMLVATPLQKVHTIDPFVDAVGYVWMEDPRSRLLSMTIAEYHSRRAESRGGRNAATDGETQAAVGMS